MKKLVLLRLLLTLAMASTTASAADNKAKGKPKEKENDPWSVIWTNTPKKPLPPGVTHHTYRSAAMKCDVGYCIYLPPQYAQNPVQRFPVIYALHGGGGNELNNIADAELLHRQIIAGKLPPFLMVLPNGGPGTFYADSVDGKVMSETTVIKELIPHVDATYRTIATRRGRMLQGFSMGALGSVKLAMKYPDLFCSVAGYAGGMQRLGEKFRSGKTAPSGGYSKRYLGDDAANWENNDSFMLAARNADKIKGRLAIKLMCGTADDYHFAATQDFHHELTKLGIPHSCTEVPGMAHNVGAMRQKYADSWFSSHVSAMQADTK